MAGRCAVIVERDGRRYVAFEQMDPRGGIQTLELEEDLFTVLLGQARSLESLRCLAFGFCERVTADAVRKQAKALAAGGGQ
jgi:hypothetical protein